MSPFPFAIIYADPPWRFQSWGLGVSFKRQNADGLHSGRRPPYAVMSTQDICALPVQTISTGDAALFLWATYPMLPDALQVMAAWGFMFKTVAFTWVKRTRNDTGWHIGLGYWSRSNPEICLLGTRGHPKRVSKRIPNLLIAPVRDHSHKPDEVRERIVALCGDLPRVELFAREKTPISVLGRPVSSGNPGRSAAGKRSEQRGNIVITGSSVCFLPGLLAG